MFFNITFRHGLKTFNKPAQPPPPSPLPTAPRRRAEQWFSAEFNSKYRGKIAPTDPTDAASATAKPVQPPSLSHAPKRRKVSSAQSFMNSSDEEEQSDDV